MRKSLDLLEISKIMKRPRFMFKIYRNRPTARNTLMIKRMKWKRMKNTRLIRMIDLSSLLLNFLLKSTKNKVNGKSEMDQ